MPVTVWKGRLMPSTQAEDKSNIIEPVFCVSPKRSDARNRPGLRALFLACLLTLALAGITRSQGAYQMEDGEGIRRQQTNAFDEMNEALRRHGKTFLKVGAVLLGIVVLKIINPLNLYYNAGDRALKRAVRNVEDLLRKIREHAETANADEESETEEEEAPLEGLLAGMTEIAEMSDADDVPAYILTVNDLMLDDIRITLKRLRRFRDGSADKYKNSIFSVITGIKTITEQSAASGAASGLAVDLHEYFEDDHHFHSWKKTLASYAKRGDYQEQAQGFLLFIKNLNQGKPISVAQPATAPLPPIPALSLEDTGPEIPEAISEDTLPLIQGAAIEEARRLCSLVRKGQQPSPGQTWQFELVTRQKQPHLRKESQKMLMVFLNCERKALQKLTKSKMLPCRTWDHLLYVLGVNSTDKLLQRTDNKLLTVQEIALLEKAFLQTFAKGKALQHVYGSGQSARVMIDLHTPQIRQEALLVLRRLHRSEREYLDKATGSLNQEETPQHNEVKRLILHYVYHRHDPPDIAKADA
jgi:hypothetical protein